MSLLGNLQFLVVVVTVVVSVKGAVDPPGTPVVRAVSSTTVVYMFQSSPTAGATYEVMFTSNRTGVPNLGPDIVGVSSGPVIRSTAGLTPATDYTLSVVAVSEGMRSSAVKVDFTTKPAIPSGPPQNMTVTNITSSSITIKWEEPSPKHINDKQGITGYQLKVDGRTVGSTLTRSYTFSNLSPGVEYTLTILAVNSVGTSEDRHGAKITNTTSSEIPGQPIIKGVLPRFSLVAISWDPPTQSGGPITAYQIEYKIDDAIHDSTVLEDSTLGRFHLVQGLGGKVGSMHKVRVRARTEAGYGPYSERVSFVFKSIVEAAVTITGCDSVSINYTVNPIPQCWNTALQDSVSEVVVSYHESTTPSNVLKRNIPVSGDGGVGQLFISGLTSGQRYRFSTEVVARPAANGPLPEDTSAATEVLLPSRDCQVPNNCSKREYFIPTRNCQFISPEVCILPTTQPKPPTIPQPQTSQSQPQTSQPRPQTSQSQPQTSQPRPQTTSHSQPQTSQPEPQTTSHSQPQTSQPQPQPTSQPQPTRVTTPPTVPIGRVDDLLSTSSGPSGPPTNSPGGTNNVGVTTGGSQGGSNGARTEWHLLTLICALLFAVVFHGMAN